jgi:hypothetical protein
MRQLAGATLRLQDLEYRETIQRHNRFLRDSVYTGAMLNGSINHPDAVDAVGQTNNLHSGVPPPRNSRINFAATKKGKENTETNEVSTGPSQEHHHWNPPHLHLHLHHPHLHLWKSHKLPHRSTEAHALARAEAASWAQMSPLVAATLGPLAVLLGIPCLTQRWHGQILDPPVMPNGSSNFVELSDPPLNLALAGITLLCEVLGNLCLVLRFSNIHSKAMTWVSYFFWIAKIIIGIANYIQFGLTHRLVGDVIYLQGFWVSSLYIP